MSDGVILDFTSPGQAQPEKKEETPSSLLDEVTAFIRRYVRLSDAQADIVTIWIAHTHALAAAHETPYLHIFSAEKRSGKSRLLEVLELLVAKPWLTSRVTAAVLVRKIDQVRPTLLLDEVDAAFAQEDEYCQAVRGVLNSGHRPDGRASLCVGAGNNITFKDFRTYSAKALAGIGRNAVPDTVRDRSIPVHLKRQAPGERVERFRRRDAKPEADEIRAALADWLSCITDELREARPVLPEELTDRQQDGLECLAAIADKAGGTWADRIRAAALELFSSQGADDDSTGVQLLTDVRTIFEELGDDKITSEELVGKLKEFESSPWGDWAGGKGLSKGKLARLLARYEITPRVIRVEGRTPRGYLREAFLDAWSRYLTPSRPYTGHENATTPQLAPIQGETHLWKRNARAPVADEKCIPNPHENWPVADVALSGGGHGEEDAGTIRTIDSFDLGAMLLVESRLRDGKPVTDALQAEYALWLETVKAAGPTKGIN